MHPGETDFIESVKASFFLENSFSNSKKVRNQNHLEVKKVPAFLNPNLEHKSLE